VVTDDLGDDERQKLLGKERVQPGIVGERSEAGDLAVFARGIRGRHTGICFEPTHCLGRLESLREEVYEGGIDVVDRRP